MSILLNDNLDSQFNKPLDTRYGAYVDIPTALAQVPLFRRYIGLTIGIGSNPVVEYWFNDGVLDTDLVLKTPTISYPVTSVNGETGAVVLDKTDIGLGNVTNVDTTNATNISSGTLGDARLSANVTLQGNTFNAANKLVQLDGTAKLPAVDGSQLTNLPTPATPTLASVTTAGNTTTNAITVGGLTVATNLIYTDTVNGRVGIGTTSPSQPLHVVGRTRIAHSTGTSLHIYNDGTTSYIDSLTGANAAHDLRISAQNISFYSGSSYGTVYAKLFNTGNFALGSNPTDAGYKLDVNGTARVSGQTTLSGLVIANNIYTSTLYSSAASNTYIALNGTNDIQFGIHASSVNGFRYLVTTGNEIMRLFKSGNLVLQNGGTFTDAGYKLDVNGTTRFIGVSLVRESSATSVGLDFTPGNLPNIKFTGNTGSTFLSGRGKGIGVFNSSTDPTAKFQVGGIYAASSAIACGLFVNTELQAAANNDVLVGLDINPTFTNGAFTNLGNYPLRVTGTGTLGYFRNSSGGVGDLSNGVTIKVDSSGNGLITAYNYTPANPTSGISSGANFGLNGSLSNFYGIGIAALRSSKYDIWFQTGDANGGGYRFYKGTTELLTIFQSGNVGINTTTDAGYKLYVEGTSGFSNTATFLNFGNFYYGALQIGASYIISTNDGVNRVGFGSGNGLRIGSIAAAIQNTNSTIVWLGRSNLQNQTHTSGNINSVNVDMNFNPTSGTGTVNLLNIIPIINQTGGANGITRGLYVNPTLTSATDFRAIDIERGTIVLGRMTSDPSTAINGMIYYNTTNNKFRGYENGSWQNLI